VLTRNPGLRGTPLHLPETVARGAEYLTALGLADRFGVAGQSFFDPLPAGADAYLLSRIIHDWDDHDAAAILRGCAQAAGQHGRVLITEGHGVDIADASFAEMDLRMLVLTGGRERTLADYRDLAGAAGCESSPCTRPPPAPRSSSAAPGDGPAQALAYTSRISTVSSVTAGRGGTG
jgi:2,7-dihydroxy-5-methyl-1-naphthoate 7-O-methyltransferase